MKPGPAPKPTILKRIAGNPGQRPLNDNEPSFEQDEIHIPHYLVEDEKMEWVRLAPMLVQVGLLTEGDEIALAILCAKLVRWKRARRRLAKSGELYVTDKGNQIQHPNVGIVNRLEADITRLITEFGLTPSSRSRISVASDEEDKSLAAILFEGVDETQDLASMRLADVVGKKQAGALAGIGLGSVARAVYAAREGIRLEKVKWIGPVTVRKLKAL